MLWEPRTTAAATCALNEDTNGAAAIEKARYVEVARKQKKTSEEDDETRRLVEAKEKVTN